MRVEDMVLVSIDDHVVEPADTFERHLPARHRDRAPTIVRGDDGVERWVYLGTATGSFGLNAVASWPPEEWGLDPVGFADMRPGAYDVDQRVRDMDANGVLASMCFPSFPGFNGMNLARSGATEPELTAAVVSAYNDWHIHEWSGSHPGRFIPLAILPLWDADLMVDEIHRVAAEGCTAVSLPETPYGVGLPTFFTDYWDPVFTALCDNDIAICMHIGGSFGLITMPDGVPIDHMIMLAPQLSALTANDLIVGGVFRRFPDLKVALSEGGIGWIPFYLDRLDRHVDNHRWTGLDIGGDGMSPTELFRRNFLGCFITDPSSLRLLDRIGEDVVAWECDYPHSDSTWPHSPEVLLGELDGAGISDAQVDKITWANASRFFRFDPFASVPRERASVGALRVSGADVDTAVTPKREYRRRYEAAGQR
jgi:predicted TIM-barrel fold metal-dependent hydrolase